MNCTDLQFSASSSVWRYLSFHSDLLPNSSCGNESDTRANNNISVKNIVTFSPDSMKITPSEIKQVLNARYLISACISHSHLRKHFLQKWLYQSVIKPGFKEHGSLKENKDFLVESTTVPRKGKQEQFQGYHADQEKRKRTKKIINHLCSLRFREMFCCLNTKFQLNIQIL